MGQEYLAKLERERHCGKKQRHSHDELNRCCAAPVLGEGLLGADSEHDAPSAIKNGIFPLD
jgi:hypothetical protein